MKKFIPLALGLAICCAVPTFATSAEPDLKSYSDEDLQKLYTDVKTELTSRNLTTGDSIGSGIYIAGTDIKSGTYTYTNVIDSASHVSIAESMDGDVKSVVRLEKGETASVVLTDGMVLSIDGTGTLEPTSPSWAITKQ